MYVVTNRRLEPGQAGPDIFGSVPNALGPNELRLVDVKSTPQGFKTQLLDDKLTPDEVKALNRKHGLELDPQGEWFVSLRVACEVMARARREHRNVLLYVHGYNNNVDDILKTANELERRYKVVVAPFSWPANGGGLYGTASYLSDKGDARVSADALNRYIGKLRDYYALLTKARNERLMKKAAGEHPDNIDARRAYYTELLRKDCAVTINLLCHSMGNYLLKYAIKPSGVPARDLVFDNVCLVAADANNKDHASWVESIPARNRVYVVINENDFALAWARRKPGEEQLARLGHYLKNLTARNAHYIDVTGASWVKNDHSYFKGEPVAKNKKLAALFAALFEGASAEDTLLRYRADINAYTLK